MRKTVTVIVPHAGRDLGKSFLLTEMPAAQAEEWAIRALGAMARSGTDIPDNIIEAGWAAIAFFGISAIVRADWTDTKPLYDEMMACVSSVQELVTRPLMAEDIEEVQTRVWLRDEVFKLHANFSIREILSRVSNSRTKTTDPTPGTQTSQEQ